MAKPKTPSPLTLKLRKLAKRAGDKPSTDSRGLSAIGVGA